MAILPISSSSLELSISIPGFASSSSGYDLRAIDINQTLLEDEGEESNDNAPRKKLRLTKDQSSLLEKSFRLNHTLNPKQKEALAFELNLRPRQVEVWFQNRRARTKLKHTEVECEYLKRCFGSLTEENKRLQRELKQLRSFKVGPPTSYVQPLPVSTLSMCPRCGRVTSTNAATTALENGPPSLSLGFHHHTRYHHHPSAAC